MGAGYDHAAVRAAVPAVRAAVLYEYGAPLVVEEVELEPPREGEVLVRLAASGVCRSDLHTIEGVHPWVLPVVMGHEGAGVVEEVGPGVTHVAPGDHVVLSWLPYCGRCRFCAAGRANLCEDLGWSLGGTMMDGTTRFHRDGVRIHHYNTSSFAERTVVPAQTAIPVDRSLPLEELALMGCAVMTGVGAVLNTARARPGESVVVVGCGGVGLSAVQGAAVAGTRPIVAVDAVATKLELARELGATHGVDSSQGDAAARVREILGGGADHVVEAVGRPETIELALELVGRGGQAVLVGLAPPEARIAFDPLTMAFEERAIRGSWYGGCRPAADFPMLVDLYRAGRLRLDALVTTCPLEGVNDAFEAMRRGEVARSVIVF
jgi:S-(hydroxymethyl)glutathione dehydrogenase / alcohol dehydrogenase